MFARKVRVANPPVMFFEASVASEGENFWNDRRTNVIGPSQSANDSIQLKYMWKLASARARDDPDWLYRRQSVG
jgi:hypothetical protein